MNYKFWEVARLSNIEKRQKSLEDAKLMADFLAKKEPGVAFVVMEAVAVHTGKPPEPPVVVEELELEKPF